MLANRLRMASNQDKLVFVGGATASKAGATTGNTTISLSSLAGGISASAEAGDMVIAVYATASTADSTLLIQDPSAVAYTLIGSELYGNGTSYDINLRVAYKILSSADASVTFGPTGSNLNGGAMAVHVWRFVSESTPLDVSVVSYVQAGGNPNPDPITPVTSGAVILCICGGAAGGASVYTASYLNNFFSKVGSDNNVSVVGIGSVAWISGSYNPALWGGGGSGGGSSVATMTIALRPA